MAKKWDKPIALHAIYEDAPLVCGLLDDYSHKNVPSLPCFLPAVATKFNTCCPSIYQ
ncbi:hypothetical protein [Bacillus sp. T3]|uniref:hypothetical protein n=1 Tax=Bacillus sp. T3 TaxID=467262 RepID=UPI0029829FD9|nr:hypothetical protein [Bacillus sp. T3]